MLYSTSGCVSSLWYISEVPPPVRLVRLWPATFPADLIIISHACVITHNLCSIMYADSAMASVSRPSCGPTIETPHKPRYFSFPKWPFACYESASSSLKIHAKILDRSALHASVETQSRTTFSMPLPPLHQDSLTIDQLVLPCYNHLLLLIENDILIGYTIPMQQIAMIVLLSRGGAHFPTITYVAGNVTP